MNGIQQRKNTFGNMLDRVVDEKTNKLINKPINYSELENQQNSQDMNVSLEMPLVLPKNKDELRIAYDIIIDALNKANKIGVIDLSGASILRSLMKALKQIIEYVISSCYKNENITLVSQQLSQIKFPSVDKLQNMWDNITKVLDAAQSKGAYDSIEESGMLYDNLVIIAKMLGSLVGYINNKEKMVEKIIENKELDKTSMSITKNEN